MQLEQSITGFELRVVWSSTRLIDYSLAKPIPLRGAFGIDGAVGSVNAVAVHWPASSAARGSTPSASSAAATTSGAVAAVIAAAATTTVLIAVLRSASTTTRPRTELLFRHTSPDEEPCAKWKQ
jgi:hypothetical protein